MNNVNILGHLTRDCEVRTTTTGKTVVGFGMALSNGKDKPATFIDVTAWSMPDFIIEKLKKGAKCLASGALKQNSYEDKAGNKRTKHFVEVNAFGLEVFDYVPRGRQEESYAPSGSATSIDDEYDPFAEE